MKQPRIISVGGCLAALLLAACGGVAPNSTVTPLGAGKSYQNTSALRRATSCRKFDVSPNVAFKCA